MNDDEVCEVNQSAMVCVVCGNFIPTFGGRLVQVKWPTGSGFGYVHLCCLGGKPSVIALPSEEGTGHRIRNIKGRCVDAPACGCCD